MKGWRSRWGRPPCPRRRRSLVAGGALSAAALVSSCSGEPSLSGVGEPIVVIGATFIQGDLPGSPPIDGGTGTSPDVTTIQSVNNSFVQGLAGASFSGDVTNDATSVAVRFPDAGTGYWVFVPGGPDATDPGNLSWSMSFNVGDTAPTGNTTLRFAAVNASGGAGTQMDQPVCIDSTIPDDFNVCVPSRSPPVAVLSLSWDTPVDLDLWLVTPTGVTVSPKHPTTSPSRDGGAATGVGVGQLDRDSDANCVADGVSREDIVWNSGTPDPGTYLVYADLFSACGQPSVRFTVTLNVATPTDGGFTQTQVLEAQGELLAAEANGGSSAGLYVTSFAFPTSTP